MVKDITDSSFQAEVLDEKSLAVLVDFWAPWCGPCRMLAPVVEQMGKTFVGKLKVVKINTEDHQAMATTYQVSGIPCLILFKAGKEVGRLVGYRPADAMETEIRKLLH